MEEDEEAWQTAHTCNQGKPGRAGKMSPRWGSTAIGVVSLIIWPADNAAIFFSAEIQIATET